MVLMYYYWIATRLYRTALQKIFIQDYPSFKSWVRHPVRASPRDPARRTLNLVAGWLVLFDGGCKGGTSIQIISPLRSC